MDMQALWQQAHRHAENRDWDQAKACFNAILEQSMEGFGFVEGAQARQQL